MQEKTKFMISGISGILFILLIVIVKLIDVQPMGPAGSEIGLATLNCGIFNMLGTNFILYKLTKLIGAGAILVAVFFAVVGALQLFNRKSLMKVDGEILALADLYIVMAGLYVLFEIVVINYRPILEDGMSYPEASFPSSHTMLTCVILGSAIILVGKYLDGEKLKRPIQIACFALIVIMALCRLLSGVHWFTDIIGGILISICLVFCYWGVVDKMK